MTIPAIRVDTHSNMRFWFGILVVIGVAAFLTWTSDSITMQGERTIYTVGCTEGALVPMLTSLVGSYCPEAAVTSSVTPTMVSC